MSRRISLCPIWRRASRWGLTGSGSIAIRPGPKKPSRGSLIWRAAPTCCSRGTTHADVAYFYGEEGPLTAVFGWKAIEDAPDGYAFDFVNSDVILHELSVRRASCHSGRHELSHSLSRRAKPAHDAAGAAQDCGTGGRKAPCWWATGRQIRQALETIQVSGRRSRIRSGVTSTSPHGRAKNWKRKSVCRA